ncbi:hypothetical protein [Moraxella sp. RCAD0137]|uniref:hypothetical protein n=1 Tax=Moraxella sp. RCAD0137 TaxID=1775913 RepID=UPI000C9EF7D3|nr:hypothetical protein [Moraxella sp. RCAD0137]PNP98681.1 hypothetical protein AZ602_03450 [Moraxella sp. RCAD0137]
MKTGEKTYFDLDVVQLAGSILGVLLDDIEHLSCADEFDQWIYGSTLGVGANGERVVYLHDWEFFARRYLNGQPAKSYLEIQGEVMKQLFSSKQSK